MNTIFDEDLRATKRNLMFVSFLVALFSLDKVNKESIEYISPIAFDALPWVGLLLLTYLLISTNLKLAKQSALGVSNRSSMRKIAIIKGKVQTLLNLVKIELENRFNPEKPAKYPRGWDKIDYEQLPTLNDSLMGKLIDEILNYQDDENFEKFVLEKLGDALTESAYSETIKPDEWDLEAFRNALNNWTKDIKEHVRNEKNVPPEIFSSLHERKLEYKNLKAQATKYIENPNIFIDKFLPLLIGNISLILISRYIIIDIINGHYIDLLFMAIIFLSILFQILYWFNSRKLF